MGELRSWLLISMVAGCGNADGGRGVDIFGNTDSSATSNAETAPATGDSLDTISASATATQGGTSSTNATSSDPSSESEPSSSSPSSTDATTESTSGPASSSSSEASGTTSCDQLLVTWGDCLNYGLDECVEKDATCIVDNPAQSTLGTCAVLDCVHDCDCPDPPMTGTAESRCDAILVGGQTACYLDCTGGATCPDGMECWQNQICMFADLVCVDPPPAGGYDDCVDTGVCNGDNTPLCLVDDPDAATTGVCAAQFCETDCDCPAAPATGDAPVTCAPIIADSEENACFLDCSSGQTCPDGMSCFMSFICMW